MMYIHISVKIGIGNDRQPMGQQRHIKGMLFDIFSFRIAHQAPAPDMFHFGKIGKKVMHTASSA